MSIAPIDAAGTTAGTSLASGISGTEGTVGSGNAISGSPAVTGTDGSSLSANFQVSLDALSGLSTRDLLLLVLLSVLGREDEQDKSSLPAAMLLLGAASMQANISIQFGDDLASGGTPAPTSGPEPTGGTVDVTA
jgi:hypothetical protein